MQNSYDSSVNNAPDPQIVFQSYSEWRLLSPLSKPPKRKPIAQGRNVLDIPGVLWVWFYLATYTAD